MNRIDDIEIEEKCKSLNATSTTKLNNRIIFEDRNSQYLDCLI